MGGEETSSTLLVEVDGRPLPDDVAARLVGGYVDDSVNLPDLFVLRFVDDQGKALSSASLKIGSVVTISVQRSGSGGPEPLVTGEVTALEHELDSAGTRTVVRGYDQSHRLFRGRRVEAYVKVSVSDVVRTVAQRAGITIGTVDPVPGTLEHVSQDGVDDWTFLHRLAADVGREVVVADGKLSFRLPEKAESGPSGTGGSRQEPHVLEKGVNIVSLRCVVTAADQVAQVEVRGWDVATKKALVARAPATTRSAVLQDVTPAGLARSFGSPDWVESRSWHGTQPRCDDAATAIADRLAASHAEIDGTVRGNPALRAGVAVTLVGAGSPFDGRYTLSSTRHEFGSDAGYQTSFAVSGSSERSLLGLTSGGVRDRRTDGVITATVSDIKDPDHKGRVRVTYPVLSDGYVSSWSRPVHVGGGKERGLVMLPEVGDEVLVAFGMGSFDEPYILGGLFNGVDTPKPGWGDHVDGTSGRVSRRALTSRTGMVVEMVETAQDERLTIATNDGDQRVTLTQKQDASIEIVAKGPVSVKAAKDALIESSSGDVSIKGTNISIEAKSDLTLKGANVTVTAQAKAELAGVSVKVAGQAAAELTASGPTTIKGAIVRIN